MVEAMLAFANSKLAAWLRQEGDFKKRGYGKELVELFEWCMARLNSFNLKRRRNITKFL